MDGGDILDSFIIPTYVKICRNKKQRKTYIVNTQKYGRSKMSKIDGNYGNFFTQSFEMSSVILTAVRGVKKWHVGSIIQFFFGYLHHFVVTRLPDYPICANFFLKNDFGHFIYDE